MRKFTICACMFIGALVSGCKRNADDVDWDKELSALGTMGDAYRNFGSDQCAGKCQWTRPTSEVLAFEGHIVKESYDEFAKKIDDEVHEIRLNSGGGDVSTAIKIASEIHRRQLKVVVKGFCISSCANYLFLAGKEKVIEGLVGFHGGAQAAAREICKENNNILRCMAGNNERAFFESIGMKNFLFDVTQSVDKGMRNGKPYMYYAPSAGTLRALGVTGISGDQSPYYLLHMRKFFEEFNLVEFSVASDPNPTILARLKVSQETTSKHAK